MRLGMGRQEAQRGHAAFLARRKAPAHDGLLARLVREGAEAEAGRIAPQVDRPAGQHAREVRHVRLGVSGGGADRVQFEAFPRQVLVQPALAALAGRAVRSRRGDVVEIQQHRGMAHDREQHVGEAPGDMRADRLLDERPHQRRALASAQRNREVVGPEPDQPLAERRRRGERIAQLRRRILAEHRPSRATGRRRPVLPVLAQRRQSGGRGRGICQPQGIRAAELRPRPGARIGGERLAATAAQAEPHERMGDVRCPWRQPTRYACVAQ